MILYNDGKTPGANPFYKVMVEAGKQLRGLLNDLGLTPASGKADKKPPGALDF